MLTVNRNQGLLSRFTDQHPISLTLQRLYKSLGGQFCFSSEPEHVFLAPALFSLFYLFIGSHSSALFSTAVMRDIWDTYS